MVACNPADSLGTEVPSLRFLVLEALGWALWAGLRPLFRSSHEPFEPYLAPQQRDEVSGGLGRTSRALRQNPTPTPPQHLPNSVVFPVARSAPELGKALRWLGLQLGGQCPATSPTGEAGLGSAEQRVPRPRG